jgi:nucleotide-binding universal stress UspA family protein
MYKHILIPTDGSPLSEMAIRQGILFAKSMQARVTAMTVSIPFHAFALDPVMVSDTPGQYEAIIDAARKGGCDLIFMASHGRKGMSALVLGSETVKVLTHSKIPVLVCR